MWVRRIGLFLLAYSLTAIGLLVLPSLIDTYIEPVYELAAVTGVAVLLWSFRPALRPLWLGMVAGAATYTLFMYWLFSQLGGP